MGMKMDMEKEGVLVVWLDGYMYGGMRYGYDVAMQRWEEMEYMTWCRKRKCVEKENE